MTKGLVSNLSDRLSYKQGESAYESNSGSILFNWKTKVVSVVMGHCKHTFDDCDEFFDPDGGEIVLLLDTIQDTIQFGTGPMHEYEEPCSRTVHRANVADKVFRFVADFGDHCQVRMIGYQCFGVASETRRQLVSNCATAIARAPKPPEDPCLSTLPRLIVIGDNIHGCVSLSGGAVTSIHSTAGHLVSLACEPVDFEIQVRGAHVSKLYCGLVRKNICHSLHSKKKSDTGVSGMGNTPAPAPAVTDGCFTSTATPAPTGGDTPAPTPTGDSFSSIPAGGGSTSPRANGLSSSDSAPTPASAPKPDNKTAPPAGDLYTTSTPATAATLRQVYHSACSIMYRGPGTEGKQGVLSVWHEGQRIAHRECLMQTGDTLGYAFKPASGHVQFLHRSKVVAEICIYSSDSTTPKDFVSMMSMGDAGAHVQMRRKPLFQPKHTTDVSSRSLTDSTEPPPQNKFAASTLTILRELSEARANSDPHAVLRVGPAPFRFPGFDNTPARVQLATLPRFDGNLFEACTALAGHMALVYLLRLSTADFLQLLKTMQPRTLMNVLQRLAIPHRRAVAAKLRKAQRALLDSDTKKRLITAFVEFIESNLARFADLWSAYDHALLLSERSTKVFESPHPLPACPLEKKMTLQRMPNNTAAIELVFDERSDLDPKADSMTVEKFAHPGGNEAPFTFDASNLPCRRGRGVVSSCLESTFVFTRDATKLESTEKWGYRLLVHPIIMRTTTPATTDAFSSFDMQMTCEMLLLLKELAQSDPKVEQPIVQALQYSLQTASTLSNATHGELFATIAQIFAVIKRKETALSVRLQAGVDSGTEALVSRCRPWLQLGSFLHALSMSLANTGSVLFRCVTACAIEANITFRGATECAPVGALGSTPTYHPSLIVLSSHVYPADSHIRVLGSNTLEATECDVETDWQSVVATQYYKQGRCQWQVTRFAVKVDVQ